MFTSQLPDDDFRVVFSPYSKSHYIKQFAKKYKGKQWDVTEQSIFDALKRIHAIQSSQQVDELKSNGGYILFKFDFAVAKTNISAKASGNRCIGWLDLSLRLVTIIVVYAKTDLPKNQSETQFILETVKANFPDYWKILAQR
jgi:hypothetical protein